MTDTDHLAAQIGQSIAQLDRDRRQAARRAMTEGLGQRPSAARGTHDNPTIGENHDD